MTYTQSQLDEAVRAAVEAERGRMAEIASSMRIPVLPSQHGRSGYALAKAEIAAAIRARGETK